MNVQPWAIRPTIRPKNNKWAQTDIVGPAGVKIILAVDGPVTDAHVAEMGRVAALLARAPVMRATLEHIATLEGRADLDVSQPPSIPLSESSRE